MSAWYDDVDQNALTDSKHELVHTLYDYVFDVII